MSTTSPEFTSDDEMLEQPAAEVAGSQDSALAGGEVEIGPELETPSERRIVDTIASYRYSRVSLGILATLGVVHALYFARAILFPIALSFVLFFLLAPLVRFFSRPRLISEAVAAAIVVTGLTTGIGFASYYLSGPVAEWVSSAPDTFRKAEKKLRFLIKPVEQIDKAAAEVTKIAAGTGSSGAEDLIDPNQGIDDAFPANEQPQASSADQQVVRVAVQQPPITTYILSSTMNFVAGAVIVVVLTYLLLAMGHRTLNSVIELISTIQDKRDFVTMIRNVEKGISRYLVTITTINIALGIVIGLVMWAVGLPDPLLLGIMAAILNFIPFVGAFLGAGITFLIGLVHLATPAEAMVGPLIYMLVNTLEGNVITPMILGRSLKLNPAMVFICIVFWGWAWGVGGIFLAVPLIGAIQISCANSKALSPVARILTG